MATKKTDQPDLTGYDVVDVSELDYDIGQRNEALDKKWAFKVNGTFYKVKPMSEWSFRTEDAFNRSDFRTWARGALVERDQFERLLDEQSEQWVRIVQHIIRESRASSGEGGSSSDS
jgi:hypothetical protein